MNDKYVKLFSEIARATSVLAEQVMEYDRTKSDEKGEQTAQIMRDDFTKLYDKIGNNELLGRADFAKLLVGSYISLRNLEDRIEAMKSAIDGYNDIIPKLDKVINDSTNDEEALKLAEEFFQIPEETK